MLLKLTSLFLVLSLAAASAFASESPPEAARLVRLMGDQKLTQDQRDAAAGSLVKLGKEAIPTLIDSLHDNRVYFPNYATSNAGNGTAVSVNFTVGQECNNILMNIVSDGSSNRMIHFRYHISNWPDWWSRHKDMGLHDIQRETIQRNNWIMQSTGQGDSIPRINQP